MSHTIHNTLKNNSITVNSIPIAAKGQAEVGSKIYFKLLNGFIPTINKGFKVIIEGSIPAKKILYYQEGGGDKITKTRNIFHVPLWTRIFTGIPPSVTIGDEDPTE